jgi:hypothetical protein
MENEQVDEFSREEKIVRFLKQAGLVVNENLSFLNGQIIPRDLLISDNKYEECKDSIFALKSDFSSSTLTCLQRSAQITQKWPLLNAIRQILKLTGFRMVPKRQANGYSKAGKKLYHRVFLVEAIRTTKAKGEAEAQAEAEVEEAKDISDIENCDDSHESNDQNVDSN